MAAVRVHLPTGSRSVVLMAPTIGWEPPTPEVAEALRSVAERMAAVLDETIEDAIAAILAATPGLESDPVLAAETRASTEANIGRWVRATVARPDAPVAGDVPPEALDLARDVVRRGMARDELLTAYRTGQNVVWSRWLRLARDEGLDGDELVAVLDVGARSLFGYVDRVLAAIATQIERERDELLGGALARRRETVSLILDGAPISQERASARLGHELGRAHVAAIVWSEGEADQGELEDVGRALARAAGAGRPFSVPAGRAAVWCWISRDDAVRDIAGSAPAHVPEGVLVALGGARRGLAGFRESHAEALAAQRLLARADGGPRVLAYADVQVVALALQDEARAGAFVAETLGDLLSADAELRETVRVYLRHDASATRAAAVLHAHRNTVLKRVARADEMLPLPLVGHRLEVGLALELLRWGGPLPGLPEA